MSNTMLPPDDADMTPQLLQCLADLVSNGATVVGAPAQHSPSLTDFPHCDAQVKKLAGELWGRCDGKQVMENSYGQGRVVWGEPLAKIFAAQQLKPGFEFTGGEAATKLAYCHRVAGATEIYFVSNQRRQFDTAECTFRVSGKTPELWHADTGITERAPVWHEQDGQSAQPVGESKLHRGRARWQRQRSTHDGGQHLLLPHDRRENLPAAFSIG